MENLKITSLNKSISYLKALIQHYAQFVSEQTGKKPDDVIKEIKELAEQIEANNN